MTSLRACDRLLSELGAATCKAHVGCWTSVAVDVHVSLKSCCPSRAVNLVNSQ